MADESHMLLVVPFPVRVSSKRSMLSHARLVNTFGWIVPSRMVV